MVRAIGKPIDFFSKIPQDANLHSPANDPILEKVR